MSEKISVESLTPTQRNPAGTSLRAGFMLLAAGAVAEAVARLLAVPWYDEPERYVDEIVAGRAAHYAGTTLSFVAAVALATAITMLWAAAPGRLARASLLLSQAFPLGLAAVASVAFFAGSFARDDAGDLSAAVTVWGNGYWGGSDLGWYAAMLGGVALAVAAAALARGRMVRRTPAALIGLGALATGATSQGPVALLLATAALLLAAGAAWATRRP